MPEKATFAGGCFWGVEELIRKIDGVIDTTVGYTGGALANPTYEDLKTGSTGHAEAIEVEFDPAKVSYAKILDHFFSLHDPTTSNRQGNDVGSQYRSAIFVHDDAQRKAAEEAKQRAQSKWEKPIVTEIVEAKEFWPAEGYHQDYLQRLPWGYNCHYVRYAV
jgi:peptide-methionine (S)-S-oxide reductase